MIKDLRIYKYSSLDYINKYFACQNLLGLSKAQFVTKLRRFEGHILPYPDKRDRRKGNTTFRRLTFIIS